VDERAMTVPAGAVELEGDLTLPVKAAGIVAFAHGSGSSRHSPRNRAVAATLVHAGLATLMLDLLTPGEEKRDLRTREHRFDVALLGGRVVAAIDWLGRQDASAALPVGLFGASTGAAAALLAAGERPDRVRALVSRGGRPDLAGPALVRVSTPTLLIVGGRDEVVLDLNRGAAAELAGEVRLEVVAGAGHLFEEPGALEQVARLARDWLSARLSGPGERGGRP